MKDANAALDEKIDAEIDLAEGLKRNHGRYTLEEAAAFISERTGEDAKRLTNKFIAAVENGGLVTYAPFSFVKRVSPVVRDFYEHVYWNDLNEWLEKNEPRLDFKFPQPLAETIDAMARKPGDQAGAPAPQNGAPVTPKEVGAGDTAKASEETPAERRAALDITTKRGCPRLILECWDDVESLHGPNADGRQVQKVLKRKLEKNDEGPTLKTIQNQLRNLRVKKLIPGFIP